MPKLAWVLLPLAAAAGWLALCAWRGRLLTRQTMNVLFSLLLLGYVAGTAGLGIFWVANQQLPVFDWHYTFGYATVLVLLVHLGFNLRIVVQHLRRLVRREPAPLPRRPSAVLAGETGGTSRRPIIGLAGTAALAAAAGVGYLVGLRHGRTELQLAASGAADARPASSAAGADAGGGATHTTHAAQAPHAAAAASEAWAVVERFHAFSAHSRTRVLRHAASTDWGEAPAPFKRYPGAERVPLPPPTQVPPRRSADPFDLAALATALWHTAGVSERRGGIAFRTSPSSGALFATELYVLAFDGLAGLPPGSSWHYDAEAHVLERVPVSPAAADVPPAAPGVAASAAARTGLAAPARPSVLDSLGPLDLPAPCHALVVAGALFARSGHKYGDRTYRYVLADLGHALENLRQAAAARGARATLLPRFDEAALAAALALDERREGVLAVVAIAPPDALHPGRERNADSAGRASDERYVTAWRAGAVQGADASARLGLTEAMHAATSLRALPAPPLRAHPNLPTVPTVPTVPTLPAGLADAPARSSDSPARSSDARTRPSDAPAPEARDAGLRPQAARPPAAQPPTPATPTPPTPSAAELHTLPPGRSLTADLFSVIARRRSVRRLSTEPLSQQMLADVLHTMTTVSPLLLPAVRIDLLTPAVAGLPPAAWRVEAPSRPGAPGGASAAIRLHRRVTHGAALRQRARAAALDQDVIGDAAAVFVLSLDRGALQADPAGAARGYRHGFIEAGLVGERIYLAAGALGLGACAVGAFYDDEAAALVGLDPAQEWPVHFAALGVPGKAFSA